MQKSPLHSTKLLQETPPSNPPPELQVNQDSEVLPSSSSQTEQSNIYSLHDISSVSGFNRVRLKALSVIVWNWNQAEMLQAYALLDEESDTTMCTSKLASKLVTNGNNMPVSVRTINGLSHPKGECISLKVQGLSESEHFQPDVKTLPRVLAVDTLPSLRNSIPSQRDVSCFNHLNDHLTISELVSQKVEHVQHDIRYGDPRQPAAVNCSWVDVIWPRLEFTVDNNEIRVNCVQTSAVGGLHEKLKRMFFRFDFS